MKRRYLISAVVLLLILFFVEWSFGAELSKIKLTDGSVIAGAVVSIDNGVYTVKTPSLGRIKIKNRDIAGIINQPEPVKEKLAPADTQIPQGQIGALQQQLLGNEEIMNMIFSLQNDPNIQKALNDPDFMKAINSWDVNALKNDPLFNEILKNPTIQQIQKKSTK